MFLLIREVSPYTGNNFIIGAFLFKNDALKAKKNYINNLKADPWKEQLYKKVDLEKDLIIQKYNVDLDLIKNNKVYVITKTAEGFGQVHVTFDSISPNAKLAAEELIKRIDEIHDEGRWGENINISEIEIGKIYPDVSRENFPYDSKEIND